MGYAHPAFGTSSCVECGGADTCCWSVRCGFGHRYIEDTVAQRMGTEIFKKNVALNRIPVFVPDFTEDMRQCLQERFEGFGLVLNQFSVLSMKVADEDMRKILETEWQRALQELEQRKKKACPACGTSVEGNAKFCTECGMRIG